MRAGTPIVIAWIVIVGACQPSPDQLPNDPGPLPADYREIIKRSVEKNYFDPYSLRDVSISMPVLASTDAGPAWLVCLHDNAKNRMGGYVGASATAYFMSNGIIARMVERSSACDDAQLVPWPEMESRDGGQGGR
jgi:hypothetical protein